MGNPEFAVASLKKIHEAGYEIAAVVTGPDRPAGRGLKIQQSPVKIYALEHGLKILQPEKLRSPEFIEELKNLEPDLGVVIAFRMLPEMVWNMPRLGTVNLHASLLPQYRGAAPINWAIINGEKETGLTTFLLKHEIDTGNILLSEKIKIEDSDNAGTLHDKMMEKGADLILETIQVIEKGNFKEQPQPQSAELKKAPKIFKEDCLVDFTQTTVAIHNKIRGLSPFPAAWCKLGDKTIKIYKSNFSKEPVKEAPGTFIRSGNTLKVAAADGYIELLELQPEGKKKMSVIEFLNGYGNLVGS